MYYRLFMSHSITLKCELRLKTFFRWKTEKKTYFSICLLHANIKKHIRNKQIPIYCLFILFKRPLNFLYCILKQELKKKK